VRDTGLNPTVSSHCVTTVGKLFTPTVPSGAASRWYSWNFCSNSQVALSETWNICSIEHAALVTALVDTKYIHGLEIETTACIVSV